MAKLIWKGEDDAHTAADGSGAGPRHTTAFGKKFVKGEAVKVADRDVVSRALKNRFFDVELTADEQREFDEKREDDERAAAEADKTAPARRGPGRPKRVADGDQD